MATDEMVIVTGGDDGKITISTYSFSNGFRVDGEEEEEVGGGKGYDEMKSTLQSSHERFSKQTNLGRSRKSKKNKRKIKSYHYSPF